MGANRMIMLVMALGFAVGGIDKIRGNRWGLGVKFEEGIQFLGTATLTMAGLLCLVPVFSGGIRYVLERVGTGGMDPSAAAGILGINMGGYSLAMELADDPVLGIFSGIIVSSMLGATVTFTIPVGLSMIEKEDRDSFARGLMTGLIPVPVGCFVSGRLIGLSCSVLILNELPVLVLALLLIFGLYFVPDKMTAGFVRLGRGIQVLALIGLILAGCSYISGIRLISSMEDVLSAMAVCSGMCIVMAGSFTVMELVMRWCRDPLENAGKRIGLNAASISGMLFSFISLVPAFALMKDMNSRGKRVCTAFFVGGTCVFGGHLSYAAAQEPDYLVPMIAGKLTAAVLGAALMLVLERKTEKSEKTEKISKTS